MFFDICSVSPVRLHRILLESTTIFDCHKKFYGFTFTLPNRKFKKGVFTSGYERVFYLVVIFGLSGCFGVTLSINSIHDQTSKRTATNYSKHHEDIQKQRSRKRAWQINVWSGQVGSDQARSGHVRSSNTNSSQVTSFQVI